MNAGSLNKRTLALYAVVAAALFLILAGLVAYVRQVLAPPPVNLARIEERRKFLCEIRAADAEALERYGWMDQAKGFVRLPIKQAMELTLREWQDPAAARSNLMARAEKAHAPPPKPPEKPSAYE
jgi:hypothetical protein